MKEFKRQLCGVLLLLILAFGSNVAKAAEINDIAPNYWAYKPIEKCITNNYLRLDKQGNFNPEGKISRVDFVTALLKVLQSDNLKLTEKATFVDVKSNTRGNINIATSKQLRIIYGYPDKTFKPENYTKRSEAASVIANITKKYPVDINVLNRFKDEDTIPGWAREVFAKNVKNDLYVNHPNEDMLRPNDHLTRAEAAVLLAKIGQKLELVEARYKGTGVQPEKDLFIGYEHLNLYEKAPRNQIIVYNTKYVIEAGNVIAAKFDDSFNSRNAAVKVGDTVNFIITSNIYTDENTLLFPANTRLTASVAKIKKTMWKDKNDKALLAFNLVILPNGNVFRMAGVPLTKMGKLVPVVKKEVTRISPKEENKSDFFINYSNEMSPVIKYHNEIGNKVYILLTGDMAIPKKLQ